MNNVLEGTLVYVCIQTPTTKYQSTEKEFKCGIVVDEDTADEWNDSFPKQSAKAVKTADFKEQYKIDPPFPSEKKQFVINLKKPAQYKDGNPLPSQYCPKVLLKQEDGSAIDITQDILPANGSKGKVSYETNENDYGTFAKLRNVLVTELIEYKKQAGNAADDFGVEVKSQGQEDFAEPETAPEKPKARAARKPAPAPEPEDFDDDVPFN